MKNLLCLILCAVAASCTFIGCRNSDEPEFKDTKPLYSPKDSLTFVKIYETCNGQLLNNPEHYSQPMRLKNISTWKSVEWEWSEETEEYRIVYINLSPKYGEVVIPECVADLDSLHVLSIRGKGIVGSIPSSIKNLTKLTHLGIEGTSIIGLPDDLFTYWKGIRYIRIEHNKYLTKLPSSITYPNFDKLSWEYYPDVHMNYNGFIGKCPLNIPFFVYLQNNKFSDVDWESYRKVPDESLIVDKKLIPYNPGPRLGFNNMTVTIPDWLLTDTLKLVKAYSYLHDDTWMNNEPSNTILNLPDDTEFSKMWREYKANHNIP